MRLSNKYLQAYLLRDFNPHWLEDLTSVFPNPFGTVASSALTTIGGNLRRCTYGNIIPSRVKKIRRVSQDLLIMGSLATAVETPACVLRKYLIYSQVNVPKWLHVRKVWNSC